jgi:DNA-binding GntR family transcriptional regulator
VTSLKGQQALALRAADAVTLTDRAYLALEENIVTLELAPGQVLSETALSQMLQIGRTPVREALHRLAREGLVTILPRRGILVSDFNITSQLKMLEVRRVVERLVAASAAERASEEERATFRRIADDMESSVATRDDRLFMRLDQEFNALFLEAARNEFAAAAVALMSGLSRRFWFMHNQRSDDLALTAEHHVVMARAIADREVARARAASDALIDHIEAITRAAVDW